MRLLLFSDLHGDAAAARRLLERSGAADVLVGTGDFGNVRRDVGVCIDVLHGSAVTLDGVVFFGLGGSVPVTPFGAWSTCLFDVAAPR